MLESDLAQDPKRASARVTDSRSRLDQVVTAMKRLVEGSNAAAFAECEALRADRAAKRDAANLASDTLFAASPLPQIGQAAWRALWEAARRYSDEVAYPGKSFPDASANDDLCVLCQQPLSPEAVQRRLTFESFVKGTTKADEELASRAYEATLAQAESSRLTIDRIRLDPQLHRNRDREHRSCR